MKQTLENLAKAFIGESQAGIGTRSMQKLQRKKGLNKLQKLPERIK